MTTQMALSRYLRESVQRDLASFADPRTEVRVTDHEATWTQVKQSRRLRFLTPLGALKLPRVSYEGVEYDYPGFFASESMADLLGLAQELPYALESYPNYVRGTFIAPDATASEESASSAEQAAELVTRLVSVKAGQTRSSLIFLQGRAGDGKSSLLTHLTHSHALRYQRAEVTWLYFYIDAQGRALARIDEAVAAILQDLRARFTYHGLSTLTRLGLLVPIIDGFDELLGSGGYEDAFASLESFVRRLWGTGALIASARSTFYKYSALGRAATRLSSESAVDIEVHPVFLRPWDDTKAAEYIVGRGAGAALAATDIPSVASAARQKLGVAADEILSSPFLLSQFVEQLQAGAEFDPNVRFLHSVIRSLIRRELVDKVRDAFGNSILDEPGHVAILGALAEEMWWQESRVLDEDTFRTICEIATEGLKLEPSALKILLERLPSHAVLARTERPVRISFRHEYYYAYFLGEYLARASLSGERLDGLLTSSRVTLPIANEFAASVDSKSDAVRIINRNLSGMKPSHVAPELRAMNAGSLAAALIRTHQSNVSGADLTGMIFESEDLSDTAITNVTFKASSFLRVLLKDIEWKEITFEDCNFSLPIFSDRSVLKGKGLRLPTDVAGVILRRGTDQTEYDPTAIGQTLRKIGLTIPGETSPAATDHQKESIARVGEFLRVVQRTLCFSEQDFSNKGKAMSNFRDILKVAERAGVIEKTNRETSGLRLLYRLRVDPDDLRAGQSGVSRNEAVRAFWSDLLS